MTSPVAATVDASGITAPPFSVIFAYFVSRFQAIYGADAYLGNDSQDGQWIGTISQAISDCNSAAVAVYSAYSPTTGQGNGLSSNVKLNGIKRIPGSFSLTPLTLVGVANTTISNGLAQDENGFTWALPTTVTIPSSGTVTVTGTCTTLGAVAAPSGTITTIQTAVLGWQSVTNSSDAVPGNAVETDAALRVRQAASVALPSLTIFDGILGAIAQVPGVTRYQGYENNTAITDSNTLPPNTLAFVVEGGDGPTLATAIAAKLVGIGTYYANTGNQYTVTDAAGYIKVINIGRPTESTFVAAVSVHTLNGWGSATEALIMAAASAYFQSVPIGGVVNIASLQAACMLIGTPQFGTFLVKAVTAKKNSGSPQATDFQLAFNEAATPGNSTVSTV